MGADRGTLLERLLRLPLFVLVTGLFALLMLAPAAYAHVINAHATGRAFFYSGLLGLVICTFVGLAHRGRSPGRGTLGPLVALIAVMVLLPLYLAIPLYEGLRTTTYLNAYLEMVSAITTTGATVFEDPDRLNAALHFWRAIVGWVGGLIMWVAAAAILAPLNLGGFEVTARADPGRRDDTPGQDVGGDVRVRLLKSMQALVPIYVGLTLLLSVFLIISGDRAFVAACHAMAILATSGISPVGGLEAGQSGLVGEAVMLLFLTFALSRLTFSADSTTSAAGGLGQDSEVRMALALIIAVPLFLFSRHWVGAYDVNAEDSLVEAGQALWGILFTVLSFLTTTGFTSEAWDVARAWSGLDTPGLVLIGLALIGGGVATTAGGVKLLRVFALYANARREMERLVHPSSISGAGPLERRLQKDGAYIAWIFFMLFAVSIAAITIALTAFAVPFEDAIILTTSGLSTTGPLLQLAGDAPLDLSTLDAGPKVIYAFAMIVGRLETLAIIALLTPNLWRS